MKSYVHHVAVKGKRRQPIGTLPNRKTHPQGSGTLEEGGSSVALLGVPFQVLLKTNCVSVPGQRHRGQTKPAPVRDGQSMGMIQVMDSSGS